MEVETGMLKPCQQKRIKAVPLQVSHVVWGQSFISQWQPQEHQPTTLEKFQNWETQLQPPHDKHRSNNLVETRLSSLVDAYENIHMLYKLL